GQCALAELSKRFLLLGAAAQLVLQIDPLGDVVAEAVRNRRRRPIIRCNRLGLAAVGCAHTGTFPLSVAAVNIVICFANGIGRSSLNRAPAVAMTSRSMFSRSDRVTL